MKRKVITAVGTGTALVGVVLLAARCDCESKQDSGPVDRLRKWLEKKCPACPKLLGKSR
ncbi:hypothetical protein ACFRI7_19110 [Streptomyces sp. NPDC056716]|uniref:hypothetical protein n=1 Tax=unclassified Streptomyces TaxID=2593676 RepID=UPI0036A1F9F6